jgi:AcrR family transcriptional regulator
MGKAARTRQFIIEKTAPVFNTKGYAGTSMADLTEATGLTKGSIYGNFENKDEVALAAFDHNWQQVNAVIEGELARQSSARDKLLVYVRVYSDYQHYPFPAGGCPILNTATEADDTHPLLRGKAVAAIAAWKRNIADLVALGIGRNEFRPDVDPEQVALTMIAMIEGTIMIAKLTGKTSLRKYVLQSVETLIDGLT